MKQYVQENALKTTLSKITFPSHIINVTNTLKPHFLFPGNIIPSFSSKYDSVLRSNER